MLRSAALIFLVVVVAGCSGQRGKPNRYWKESSDVSTLKYEQQGIVQNIHGQSAVVRLLARCFEFRLDLDSGALMRWFSKQ